MAPPRRSGHTSGAPSRGTNGPAGDDAVATPTHWSSLFLRRAEKYSTYEPDPARGGTTSGAHVQPCSAQAGSRLRPSPGDTFQGPVGDGAVATGIVAVPLLVPYAK